MNYVHDLFKGAFFLGQPAEPILQAIAQLQQALAPTGFAMGQFSIADIAVAPFLMRMMLFLKVGLGAYSAEDGRKMRDALGSEKFARFARYIQDLHERPSIKDHWDEVGFVRLGTVSWLRIASWYAGSPDRTVEGPSRVSAQGYERTCCGLGSPTGSMLVVFVNLDCSTATAVVSHCILYTAWTYLMKRDHDKIGHSFQCSDVSCT